MNKKERKEITDLTKEVIGKVDELYKSYRMKVAEVIENEEEKIERLEEYFTDPLRVDEIQNDIDVLESTLEVFEDAVDMMKGVEYV